MSKKKYTPFAEHDGNLYVEMKAVMHPLTALIDGLELVTFKRSKRVYLRLSVALAWCRKEILTSSNKPHWKTIIEVLEKFEAQEAKSPKA